MRFGKTAIDDIYEDLYELRSSSELKDQNFNSLGLKNKLELKNISFKYQDAEKLAIQDISFTLPVGEVLGIVGSTGCGKAH